jgi:hypothetical protein
VPARQLWIQCLLQGSDVREARAQFAQIEALRPPNLEALRGWFAGQVK